MLVGRNPGADEDRTGRPFIGRAGRLLRETLTELQINSARVIITNTVKCYTHNNRPPTDKENRECSRRFLVHELNFFRPRLVVALGADALRTMYPEAPRIGRARQQLYQLPSLGAWVMGIYHPSAALRSGSNRRAFVEDWNWLVLQPEFVQAYST